MDWNEALEWFGVQPAKYLREHYGRALRGAGRGKHGRFVREQIRASVPRPFWAPEPTPKRQRATITAREVQRREREAGRDGGS